MLEEEEKLREGEEFKREQRRQRQRMIQDALERQEEVRRLNVEATALNQETVQRREAARQEELEMDRQAA